MEKVAQLFTRNGNLETTKKMKKKHRSHKTVVLGVIVISMLFSFVCPSKRIWLSTNNFEISLYLDFQKKTFKYFQKSPFVTGEKISEGKFRKTGDTLVLISNFDIFNLPLAIHEQKQTKPHTLYFNMLNSSWQELKNNNPKVYDLERKNLYVIVNDEDTLSFENDTIFYNSNIQSVQLISLIKSDNRELIRTYPFLFKDTSNVSSEEFESVFGNTEPKVVFKSKKYQNKREYSSLILDFEYNYNYTHYQTLNEKIIYKRNEIVWCSNLFPNTIKMMETNYDNIARHSNIEGFFKE